MTPEGTQEYLCLIANFTGYTMNVSLLLLLALPLFYLAYRYYSRYLANILGEDDSRQTPAVKYNDGVDYVPSEFGVVFSHHFSAIAGAGPVIGPTVALLFGYLPAWLWVVTGGILFGAAHDYVSLMVSMREKGRSMSEVSRSAMGKPGFVLFIAFSLIMITLVTASFLGLTATALTSLAPAAELKVNPSDTILHIVQKDGRPMVQIGGIASTSVLVMTFFAPILGYLVYKRNLDIRLGAFIAFVVGVMSIVAGLYFPVSIDATVWMGILTVYCFLAAGVPVWLLLQPRDLINSFILYLGIAILLVAAAGGGLSGATMNFPPLSLSEGEAKLGMLLPFLFITVACGAISGFHAMVTGGTVAKQVSRESHARKVGYGGMLLESLLSVAVIVAVGGGLEYAGYLDIVFPAEGKSNPILAFSLGMGNLLQNSLGIPAAFGVIFGILMVEGFVITTLDAAVRLNRYLLEELWLVLFDNPPAVLRSYYFNAGISVALMFYLAYSQKFLSLWPIFGAGNQLLASLTLVAVSLWLVYRGKTAWFTLLPAIFMMATTLTALYQLLVKKYLPAGNTALVAADLALMALALGVIVLAVRRWMEMRRTLCTLRGDGHSLRAERVEE